MSIIDKMKVASQHNYKLDDFRTLDIMEESENKTGRINTGMDRNEEYHLTLTLGVNFWANKAQYPSALKTAEKMFIQQLHIELLGITECLRSAIYAGDAKEALRFVDAISKEIGL